MSDKRNGRGTMKWGDKQVSFVGQWNMGATGAGKFTDKDGKTLDLKN
jgi:hypothetical protein